ncbi:Glutathione import ATP-binding protein GsiA [Veillonella criceti]|uniref:Glutathione import ATP-binding protein GsiA n=2 Tax=Veillonella criceti TaxID=103891 RepID=A0A380NL28_9FIRM|nr:Glutathione import ATP-binding protein GsiA [Veillonella criceti]
MSEQKKILEIKHLHTHFFTDDVVVKAVDDVSLVLEEGSTLGIVGESGSGKSVTALSVMNLLMGTKGKVVEGEILLNGDDIVHIPEEKKRELRGGRISMIFQEPMTSLNPVMTIGNQLIECIKNHESLSKKEAYDRARNILEMTGVPRVDKMMKEYPFQLSGGQRQRVMIAMALICEPEVLIADEPTTALDVTIQAQILDLMNRLKEKIGTSILFITHDLGVVAEICDHVAVMYCGRVVETADVYSLFGNTAHPYTQGLLASIPKLGEKVEELTVIPGNVPNPRHMPIGCKFSPRCSYAFERCFQEEPRFFEVAPGHLSRCWLNEPNRLKPCEEVLPQPIMFHGDTYEEVTQTLMRNQEVQYKLSHEGAEA